MPRFWQPKDLIMPAPSTETLPDGRILSVAVDISYKASDLRQPIPPRPQNWSWENMHPATCGRLTAPRAFAEMAMAVAAKHHASNIHHFEKSARGDGRITVVFWNEPVVRKSEVAYDPISLPNIVEVDTRLTEETSPTGKPVHLIRKVQFKRSDVRLNVEPKSIDLHHRTLLPGQGFLIRGPAKFIMQRVTTLGGYVKPDASARNYYKRVKECEDGDLIYLVWCEKLDQ